MNNDKVDHPRKGSKDLADAVCGAIYNSIAHTPRNLDQEVEVHDWESINEFKENRIVINDPSVIRAPKNKQIPEVLKDYLESLDFI